MRIEHSCTHLHMEQPDLTVAAELAQMETCACVFSDYSSCGAGCLNQLSLVTHPASLNLRHTEYETTHFLQL